MHGIKTIHQLNHEAAEAANILERHGHEAAATLVRENAGIPPAPNTLQHAKMNEILANGNQPHV